MGATIFITNDRTKPKFKANVNIPFGNAFSIQTKALITCIRQSREITCNLKN